MDDDNDIHRAIQYAPFFRGVWDVLDANGACLRIMQRDEYVSNEALRLARSEGPSSSLRIVGALGSGGKLRYQFPRRFYVDGYREDETLATIATEERINTALADFCAAWTGPSPWSRT